MSQPFLICLSAYDDRFFREVAIEAGMNDYYVKPLGLEMVDKIISESGLNIEGS